MSACRVARRIASMTLLQNASSDAVRVRTLVTKVYGCFSQFFSPWHGGRTSAKARRRTVTLLNSGEWSSAGVPLFPRHGGARRVGCSLAPAATPFITAALVTKEKKNGGSK
jgi:hypothetical protein